MELAGERGNRLARWYESTPRPGWALAGLAILLYAPSLGGGFVVDDHRMLRILADYDAGRRARPDVYRFLSGEASENRAEREAGSYPWWVSDALRYRHLRPAAEWMLYGEYRLFGERAWAYRLASLGLYVAGALCVLALLGEWLGERRWARWAGAAYCVAASHAVTVTFISAQCDLLAVVLAAGAMICAGRYARLGGTGRWLAGTALLGAGLFAKEAVLPVAALPICYAMVHRSREGRGRAVGTAVSWCVMGLAWLGLYVWLGCGSNSSLMLDPVYDAGTYLRMLPYRAMILLSTWVIPVNPFLFEFQFDGRAYVPIYAVAGAACFLGVVVLVARSPGRRTALAAAALWVAAFMPILVCTPTDDRVMMLPSIGLAALGAAWMTRAAPDRGARLARLPMILFLWVQGAVALGAGPLMGFMEGECQRKLGMMRDLASRPVGEGDQFFVLNSAYPFDGLFMQDRAQRVAGLKGATVHTLGDVERVRVSRLGERSLRIEAEDRPLLSGYLGRMGSLRGTSYAVGQAFELSEMRARIVRADSEGVRAVEFSFRRPLEDEHYFFFETSRGGEQVRRWHPPGLAGR